MNLTIQEPRMPRLIDLKRQASLWHQFQASRLPWNRVRLKAEFIRRDVYAPSTPYGNALQMLKEGRLELGRQIWLEHGVTLSSAAGRIRLGEGVQLNRGVTISAADLVEMGDHSGAGQGCYITDADHRVTDPDIPLAKQPMIVKGPTIIGDNVWIASLVVITSGVTIGSRSVIGAGSVVTRDIPPYSIAVGAPAKVVGHVELDDTIHPHLSPVSRASRMAQ